MKARMQPAANHIQTQTFRMNKNNIFTRSSTGDDLSHSDCVNRATDNPTHSIKTSNWSSYQNDNQSSASPSAGWLTSWNREPITKQHNWIYSQGNIYLAGISGAQVNDDHFLFLWFSFSSSFFFFLFLSFFFFFDILLLCVSVWIAQVVPGDGSSLPGTCHCPR